MHSSAFVTCRALAMLICAIVIPLVAIFGGPLCNLGQKLVFEEQGGQALADAQTGGEAPRFTGPESTPFHAAQSPASAAWPTALSPAEPASTVQGGTWGSPPTEAGPRGPIVVPPPAPGHPDVPVQVGPTILASYETAAVHQPPRPVCLDKAEAIQQRLRQLGAVYYMLESWGQEGNYRFVCRIAIDGNPEYTRYFEATGRDGLTAMNNVLQQVEAARQHR